MFKRIADNLRIKMVSLVLRVKAGRELTMSLDVHKCWTKVQRCLVCLGDAGISEAALGLILDRLEVRFPGASIVVVTLPGGGFDRPVETVRHLAISRSNFGFLGLPSKETKALIKSLHVDVALDLSPEFNPLSAYFCLLSEAPLRIGFAAASGDLVFNYQIAPRPDRSELDRYRVLASYIG